jgi:hypothetical protein
MVAAVEYRFGQVSRLPVTIEWLSDNGSCYVAGDTRSFARDNRGRRLSKVHRATEWLKPSFARSSATMSASVRDQMPKPQCVSCRLGSPTTTRFTRTRLSDIVHPVSSSQLTQDPDRVRSFGATTHCIIDDAALMRAPDNRSRFRISKQVTAPYPMRT